MASYPTTTSNRPVETDSGAFFKVAAMLLGFAVGVVSFVALMLWVDARDARDEAPAQRRPPRPAQQLPRDGCYIKGNINGEGARIYHVPGASSYENTVIDADKGERWFCTEAEARSAGWRPPRN